MFISFFISKLSNKKSNLSHSDTSSSLYNKAHSQNRITTNDNSSSSDHDSDHYSLSSNNPIPPQNEKMNRLTMGGVRGNKTMRVGRVHKKNPSYQDSYDSHEYCKKPEIDDSLSVDNSIHAPSSPSNNPIPPQDKEMNQSTVDGVRGDKTMRVGRVHTKNPSYQNPYDSYGYNNSGFDSCGNNREYYSKAISTIEETHKKAVTQMNNQEFMYSLVEVRNGLESGLKLLMNHFIEVTNDRIAADRVTINDMIKICYKKGVIDKGTKKNLHAAKNICSHAIHDNDNSTTIDQVFKCCKILEEFIEILYGLLDINHTS